MPAAIVPASSRYGLLAPQGIRFSTWVFAPRIPLIRSPTVRFSSPQVALVGANEYSLKRLAQLTVGAYRAVKAGAWASCPAINWRAGVESPSGPWGSWKAFAGSARRYRPW